MFPSQYYSYSSSLSEDSMNKKDTRQQLFDRRETLGLICNKCGNSIEEPMISQECLHRFCAVCIRGMIYCPDCGISTHFKFDLNFALIISKVKSQERRLTKRKIVDVLNNDGPDFLTNGRQSRVSTAIEGQQNSKLLSDDLTSHCVNPSTSSYNGDPDGTDNLRSEGRNKNTHELPNIINYIPLRTSTIPALTKSAVEEASWNRQPTSASYTYNRISFNRDLGYESIVLWPDGENYKLNDLPKCLLRPRYLLVPPEASVAHLINYLFKRAELETDKKLWKYRIELMQVEEEREELRFWMDPSRDIEYLIRDFKNNLQENAASNQAYMLIVRKTQDDSNFNTNLIMRHPFQALSEEKPLTELIREHNSKAEKGCIEKSNPKTRQDAPNMNRFFVNRPLKIVFRFVHTM